MKETLRQHLGQSCSNQEIRQWFDPLGISTNDQEKRLRVTFPHALFAEWFAANMQARFEEQVSRVLGPGYVLDYGFPAEESLRGAAMPGHKRTMTGLPFGLAFTFENFLVGKGNQFPYDLVREVVEKRDAVYNPLVLFGVSGSGKSHLLKAMGNELSKTLEKERIFLGNMEDVRAIYARHGSDTVAARQECCGYDYFLVDDFQAVNDYNGLHNELLAIFDHCHTRHKQMVFCLSTTIHDQEGLPTTIQSRLNASLKVNLKEPDLDILVKFINRMCRNKRISLTKSQVLTLAQRFRDFRSLQGILLKLFAFKNLVQSDITEKVFHKIIDPTSDTQSPSPVTPEQVIEVVAREFEIQPRDILGQARKRDVVQARQTAMFLCRELMGSSFPQLGRIFGGKDHSTVMHSVKKIDRLQSINKEMKTMLTRLKKTCLSLDER